MVQMAVLTRKANCRMRRRDFGVIQFVNTCGCLVKVAMGSSGKEKLAQTWGSWEGLAQDGSVERGEAA
jgi:hypothetical protein